MMSTATFESSTLNPNTRKITASIYSQTIVSYYLLADHAMMHLKSEDISSNYRTVYTNSVNNFYCKFPF